MTLTDLFRDEYAKTRSANARKEVVSRWWRAATLTTNERGLTATPVPPRRKGERYVRYMLFWQRRSDAELLELEAVINLLSPSGQRS